MTMLTKTSMVEGNRQEGKIEDGEELRCENENDTGEKRKGVKEGKVWA